MTETTTQRIDCRAHAVPSSIFTKETEKPMTSLIQTPVQEEAVTAMQEPKIIACPTDAAMLSEERVEHTVEWDDLEEILSEEWEIGGAAMTFDVMKVDVMTINTMS
jgi:hypothetical protein